MEDSEEWSISTEYPGYKVKTILHARGKIEVFRPILNEAERKKIESHVKNVSESSLRQYYIRMEREQHEQQNHN